MNLPTIFAALTGLDIASLIFLIGGWLVVGYLVENPPHGRPSVSLLMRHFRREWMRQFVAREVRIFDASIVDSLRQGTSFFASACLIAIGGGIALAGNPEQLQGLASGLAHISVPIAIWQAKILLVILFLTNALLKFVWSNRLFGYCAILMAAVPNDPTDPSALPRAEQAAEINISAARNFNQGLSAVYFALGSMGWFLGAGALFVSAAVTIYVISRREFASKSRKVLLRHDFANG
ncbi:MAG: DUF599 domain-containing protein [Paracoccaceae bacterium]